MIKWERDKVAHASGAALRRGRAPLSPYHLITFSPAFTLIEMLVSLAVLAMAISVVGVVFRITTQTAGQAAAYSETLNWVRQFTNQVQEDLRYCDPSKSILVLVGRTQRAARTEDDRAANKYYRVLLGNPSSAQLAGYDPEFNPNLDNANPQLAQYSDPRADIMMFFSNRPTVSQAPDANSLYAAGLKFAPIQVVYGHAALGRTDPNGTSFVDPPVYIDNATGLSPIPLVRWQLARRAVIIDPNWPLKVSFGVYGQLGNEWQRITRGEPNTAKNLPGDVAALDLPYMLRGFGPRQGPGPSISAAICSPYHFDAAPTDPTWDSVPPTWSGYTLRICLLNLLYNQGIVANHHVATVLEQVPMGLRGNLGLHMLPACVWFQVEFLMPEDPRNSVQYTDPSDAANVSKRTDMPRWTAIDSNTTYVFVPDTQENRDLVAKQVIPNGPPIDGSRLATFARLDQTPANDASGVNVLSNRIIRMWPYAIRITVRVYDPRGRLDQPIVRSIVHRFD